MAEEMVNYSKNNILAQAGQSMLAQANQSTPVSYTHLDVYKRQELLFSRESLMGVILICHNQILDAVLQGQIPHRYIFQAYCCLLYTSSTTDNAVTENTEAVEGTESVQ